MDLKEAILARHSVRSYKPDSIPEDVVSKLKESVCRCNKEGDLHIQLVLDEPAAFDGFMAHYGKFSGVHNYIALVGKKDAFLEEKAGYYGEQLVLEAQMLGLNSCWVALTFSKGKVKSSVCINQGEKLACVIALGYGETQGVERKTKPIDELCDPVDKPEWFLNGMQAATHAPTAMNQQKFFVDLQGENASFKSLGGFYSKIDLGIVMRHFEVGSNKTVQKPWKA